MRARPRTSYKQVDNNDENEPVRVWYVFMAVIIGIFMIIVIMGSLTWGGDQRWRRWDDSSLVTESGDVTYYIDTTTFNQLSSASEATLLSIQGSIANLTERVAHALASLNVTL